MRRIVSSRASPPASSSSIAARSSANAASKDSAAISGSIGGASSAWSVVTWLLVVAIRPAPDAGRHEHTKAEPDGQERGDRDRETDELHQAASLPGPRTEASTVAADLAVGQADPQRRRRWRLSRATDDRLVAGPADDRVAPLERALRVEDRSAADAVSRPVLAIASRAVASWGSRVGGRVEAGTARRERPIGAPERTIE